MKVKLILATPQEQIGEMAKICYATKALEAGGKDITSILVHDNGHLAALRFAYATITVSNISIACQNQMVRSKHLDFMVQSKRYVNAEKGDFKFIMPTKLNTAQTIAMENHWDRSLNVYKELIKSGIKKEDARAVLPANTSTNMNITGNLQAWNDMFKLRLSPHAQLEIRTLAMAIYELLSNEFPLIFTTNYFEKLSS